jgi:hypothetical protein
MGQIRVLVFTEVVMSGKPIIRSISGLCRKDGRGLSLRKVRVAGCKGARESVRCLYFAPVPFLEVLVNDM